MNLFIIYFVIILLLNLQYIILELNKNYEKQTKLLLFSFIFKKNKFNNIKINNIIL